MAVAMRSDESAHATCVAGPLRGRLLGRLRGCLRSRALGLLTAAMLAAGGALALPSGAAAAQAPQIRIIGGTIVPNSPTAWPFIAAMLDGGGRQFCGGTLIKAHWVLTAAHCGTVNYVLVGSKKITGTDGEVIAVVDGFIHPAYNDVTHENDIQLLLLQADTAYAADAIPLITAAEDPAAGTTVQIAGWGDTDPDPNVSTPSDDLQEATVEVMSNADCQAAYPSELIAGSMLCAAHFAPPPATDTCQGDSGGPLVHDVGGGVLKLAGITSWGYGCAQSPYPGVYTRVSSFVDWVSMITRRYLSAPGGGVSLGSQMLGTASAPVNVHLTSSGDLPVTANSVATTNPAFTVVGENCTSAGAIPAGGGCDVQVTFTPIVLGAATGELVVDTDAEAGDTRVDLSGIGLVNPDSKGAMPPAMRLRQSRRAKKIGKRLTVAMQISYLPPPGSPPAVACFGGVKATTKLRGMRPVHTGASFKFSSSGCVAVLNVRLPAKARGKRATVTVSHPGNQAVAPATKKFKIRIR